MEVLIGADDEVGMATRAFLQRFTIIELDGTVALRRKHRMRLPDAIIWASADVHSMLLVTRNTKDFPGDMPGIRVPYAL